jgi:uncharacterized membrane protein
MPFCSQCGNPAGPADRFCHRCGARQPLDSPPGSPSGTVGADPLSGLSPRTASILCYIPVIGWIAAIVVLATDRFRHLRPVRFHAFQGLYLGVAWVLNDWVLGRMLWFSHDLHVFHGIAGALLLGASIFMMVKAAHEQAYALPLFGELAQRSLTED